MSIQTKSIRSTNPTDETVVEVGDVFVLTHDSDSGHTPFLMMVYLDRSTDKKKKSHGFVNLRTGQLAAWFGDEPDAAYNEMCEKVGYTVPHYVGELTLTFQIK